MDIKQGIKERDERIELHNQIIKSLSEEIKALKPQAEIIEGKYTTKLNYYFASVVNGKIKISKEDRSLYIKDKAENVIKGKFLTENEARQAISEVMPLALDKFKACKDAYFKLCSEMQFNVGFNYDGDTHGIYNEYEYISFKIGEFSFQFPIDN